MIEWNTGSKPFGPQSTVVPSTCPRNRFQSRDATTSECLVRCGGRRRPSQ